MSWSFPVLPVWFFYSLYTEVYVWLCVCVSVCARWCISFLGQCACRGRWISSIHTQLSELFVSVWSLKKYLFVLAVSHVIAVHRILLHLCGLTNFKRWGRMCNCLLIVDLSVIKQYSMATVRLVNRTCWEPWKIHAQSLMFWFYLAQVLTKRTVSLAFSCRRSK